MSINRYFILAVLVIFSLLACGQAALVMYFKDKVHEDIHLQSQVLTKKVIGQAKEDIDKLIINLSSGTPQVFMLETDSNRADVELVPKPKRPDVPALDSLSASEIIAQQSVIEAEIEKAALEKENLKATLSNVIETLGDEHVFETVFHEEKVLDVGNQSYEAFAEWILWSIFLTSLLAITILLMISKRLTRPVSSLKQGFNALSDGQLGTQLPAQGVAELAECIQAFNQTSLRLAQLSQAEAKLEQQRQLVELGELSRSIAHSLRNPLHTLGLTLEQFWLAESKALQTQLKDMADNKIAHLNKSISALLTLSHSEVDRAQTVPVLAVVQDILLELSSEARYFNIQVDSALAITGVESEIRTLLHTVMINALEASIAKLGDALPDASILLEASGLSHKIIIEVQDKGNGFDNKVLTQLFQPHVSSKAEGAGMGLYLAERIIRHYYQGAIEVKNIAEGAQVQLIFSTSKAA